MTLEAANAKRSAISAVELEEARGVIFEGTTGRLPASGHNQTVANGSFGAT